LFEVIVKIPEIIRLAQRRCRSHRKSCPCCRVFPSPTARSEDIGML